MSENIRNLFAGMALQSLIYRGALDGKTKLNEIRKVSREMAKKAFAAADAMMDEYQRSERTEERRSAKDSEPPRNVDGKEDLFPLLDAAKLLPKKKGRKISKATLYRWAKSGRLKTVTIGESLFTSKEYLDEFLGRSPDPRQERLDKANREADELGLK